MSMRGWLIRAGVTTIVVMATQVIPDYGIAADFVPQNMRTTVKPLDLSRPPTTAELMAAGQLGGALFPTDSREDAADNLSFGRAMEEWNRHNYARAARLLKNHLKSYPDSPWAAEAKLHLGCDAQYHGRYGEARRYFESILADNKDKSHPGASALADKARLRLGVLKVFQNNLPEAATQFRDLKKSGYDWRERTYAGHWLHRINRMKKSGPMALNCGNQALASLLEREGRPADASRLLATLPPSEEGQSMQDLAEGSGRFDYPLEARIFLPEQAAALPVPAIVHLPADGDGDSGHYWVVDRVEGDSLTLFDPQAGKYFVQSAEEFAEQWDGAALVKAGSLTGSPLSEESAGDIFGGCCGVPRAEDDLGCPDGKCKKGPSMNGGVPNGSPTWTVNMVNMNFFLTDIPLWYTPPVGPPVELQLSYNSQSAIAMNEPFGNKWQFSYASYLVVDTAGEVTVFMPDGRREVYSPQPGGGYLQPYRGFNTLTNPYATRFELRTPEGMVYVYDIPAGTTTTQQFLVELKDTHNQKLTFGYNPLSFQLTTITDATGKATNITYQANGLVSRVTDPFGRHADFIYDVDRNLVGITDMGGYWTHFTYNADVFMTSIQNAAGAWQVYFEPADGIGNGADPYPPPGGSMWENYRLTITNPQGGREEYYYDGYHGSGWYVSPRHYGTEVRTLVYEFFPTSGTRAEIGSVTTAERVASYYDYDADGNVEFVADGHELGHPYEYAYNSKGRVISEIAPNESATDFNYAANEVDVTSIVNGLGTVSFAYNAARDLTSITDRMGNATSISYNGYGQPTTITAPLGIVTSYTYDAGHYLTQISRNGTIVKAFTYDDKGRTRTVTDDVGITLTYDYNNLDDVTRITWPDGKYVAMTYSTDFPHITTGVTDRAGRSASFVYDSLKRLTQMITAEGGLLRSDYDKDGNMVRFVDANGVITRFAYDNDGRLTTKVRSDGSNYAFSYDSAGLLASVTNARKVTKTYSYDANHNLTGITYGDSTPPVTFQYDAYNRRVDMRDGAGVHLFNYNANSALTSIDGPWTNDTITFQFDVRGRRTGVAVQGGISATAAYDSLDRITSILTPSGAYTFAYQGGSPLVTSLTRPNGSVTTTLYDSLARITELANKTSGAVSISNYQYAYNGQDQRSGETVTGGLAATFAADKETGYGYNALNQLISSTEAAAFAYDADGNMTSGLTPAGFPFTATYDAESRLTSFQFSDGGAVARKTTFTYNGDGFLEIMRKFSNGVASGETRYVRERWRVLQERDSSNAVTGDYTWGGGYGWGVGGLLELRKGGNAYSYLYDGKGNVTGLLNASQSIVASYAYDPFGTPLGVTGTVDQPFRYSTKPYDAATGLSYYGYRFYQPETGRWLTRDPLGELGGVNLYGFVGNNPVNRFDPTGLAYFAFRPLQGSVAIHTEGNAVTDYLDLETAHENIFFEDAEGGDLGFFQDGVSPDNPKFLDQYSRKSEYYEDGLLREAIKNVKVGKYDLLWNNCQKWATRVKKEYNRLKEEREWHNTVRNFLNMFMPRFFMFS